MALGGGEFLTQNKILPGSYINFVSSKMSAPFLSDRGYCAIALPFGFAVDDEIFTVTSEQFQKDSFKIFGYEYTHESLKIVREIFKNATTCHFFRLNKGTVATNALATAKRSGTRGNSIKISILKNIDDDTLYNVVTYLDDELVDEQIVKTGSDLVENDFVRFNITTLTVNNNIMLSGGTDAVESTYSKSHQTFLSKIEQYSVNAIGAFTDDNTIIGLYNAFTKRMRDTVGAKFQTVVYKNTFDYEGTVSVENKVLDDEKYPYSLIGYTTGIISSCPVNKSNTNKKYDGEYTVDTDYTQTELEQFLLSGKFVYHKVGNDVRVLDDINTFITETDTKSEDFKSNQTIRVLDQIANDIAVLFNKKYLGNVANDKSGRLSFWNDLVAHHQTLEKIRAIENFEPDDIVIEQGNSKKSVVVYDVVTPTNAMAKLYMTTKVQ